MNTFFNLKLAWRAIKRKPAFSLIVMLTLAIATSTSIVVFSYIDAVLLTPLPFEEPDRLVRIQSLKGDENGFLSYPEFLDMQKELAFIEELTVYRDGGRYNLSGDGKTPEDLTVTFASSNLFKVLGVDPVLGDHWPETLDKRGSHTVMLTHEFWERRYDSSGEIPELTLDGFTYANYGVMPEGFSFPGRNEAFRAMAYAEFVVTARNRRLCIGLARLKEGVTLAQFNEELERFAKDHEQRHSDSNRGITFVAEPLEDLFLGNLYNYLLLIAGAVVFLLVIAAVNVSNLLVGQAIRQSREMTVRRVLGSSQVSIIKGFVTHSFLLAFLGSMAGLALAWFIMEASYGLVSSYLPHWINVSINTNVLLYTFSLALLLGLVTGVAPWVLHLNRTQLISGLKEGQQTTGSKRQRNLQKGLAMVQILVSVLMMVAGALLYKSFQAAQEADLGFETDRNLTFRIALSWYKYGGQEKKRTFFESSLREIESIPGVEAVAMNSVLPLTDMVNTSPESQAVFTIEGQSALQQSENPFVSIQRITPNYFDVLDIDLANGQGFDPMDAAAHQFQVVIDENLAKKMWPRESAIGKRIKLGSPESERPLMTIVGVTENVKHQSITEENIPSIYISLLSYTTTDAHYVVKTSRPASEINPLLSETILNLDQNQPTFEYLAMEDHVASQNWHSKVSSALFLAIAIIGSFIAAIGLFSIMTFLLILKVKELALRRVLGARDRNILQLVLKELLWIAGVGIGGGILLAPVLLQPLLPFLFETELTDLPVYLFVGVMLLLVSVLAVLFPSWKALFINPVTVLRKD